MAPTLLDELSPASAARLRAVAVTRSYRARSFVFHQGDEPHSAFVLGEGLLRVDRPLRSGRSVLVTLTPPGELCGELSLLDRAPRSATAMAVVDSVLMVVPAARFVELLAADQDFTHVVLARITRRLRALTEQFVEAAAYGAGPRVAARLLDLVAIADVPATSPLELRLPITQDELAQWAGLSREGVVKGLAELRHAAIIETGRRRVKILDLDALRRRADSPSS